MKKTILSLCFLLLSVSLHAEVMQFRSNAFAYKNLNENGAWDEWSDWNNAYALLIVDFEKNNIDVYNPEHDQYTIYDYDYLGADNEGDKTFVIYCIDKEGTRCEARIVTTSNGQIHFYIDYDNARVVYNIEKS